MMGRVRVGAAVLLCAFAATGVLGGCSNGSSDSLTTSARRALRSDMSALASAAASGNRGKARTALATLQADLGRLHGDGGVSDDAFTRIQDSANAVALSLGEHPSTSSSSRSSSAAPSASSSTSSRAATTSRASTTSPRPTRTRTSSSTQPPTTPTPPTPPSSTPAGPTSKAPGPGGSPPTHQGPAGGNG